MSTASRSSPPHVGNGTLTLYSMGAVSTGIKLKILESFLLIFYNQAVGLPATAVATALLVATIFDTVTDPVVGWYSDRLRSRLGRRHPLMYGSAVPLALAFFLLWNPPRSLGNGVYAWMMVNYLVVRFGYTLYENSSKALGPELVTDYDRRTTLVSLRILFRTVGGLAATVLAYQYFLKPAADGIGGVTDRTGYFAFGLFCGAVILVTILVSARATQWYVPWLSKPEREEGAPPWRAFSEIATMMRNRSALAIIAVGMFVSVSSGLRNGLELYFGLYFWGLSQAQLSVIATLTAVATFAGAVLVPILSRRFGKRRAALATFSTSVFLSGLPILLRLLGLMPPNGSDLLFVLLAADTFMTGLLYITTAVLLNSMLTDVTDELAVMTGRRSEGLLFAADGFFSKLVSGIGVLASGALLGWVAFPAHARVGAVSVNTLWWLGAIYLPLIVVVNAGAIAAVWSFRIDRSRHEQNLRTLATVAQASDTATANERAPSALD